MARWSDLAQWAGPTQNRTSGGAVECRGVVVHIADGTYLGTIAWQRNPGSAVSSHFIVAKDGRCSQMVDTDDKAWTQRAGNGHWISVEFEGFTGSSLTEAQIDVCARILLRCHTDHGVPLQVATAPSGKGLGHHSMGFENGIDWGHQFCPGPPIVAQKPAIVARAVALLNPPKPPEDDVSWSEQLSNGKVTYSAADWLTGSNAAAQTAADEGAVTNVKIDTLAAKVDGLVAVLHALAQGNTSIDTAVLLTRIDQRAAEDVARDQAQLQKIAELEAELAQLRAATKAGAQAEADGLTGPPGA